MSQERIAAIVGIHEYPLRDVGGLMSPLQIKAACAAKALEDAGLSWADVDGLYDAGDGGGAMSGLNIAEYFGLKPNVIDTTCGWWQLLRVSRGARKARHRRRKG